MAIVINPATVGFRQKADALLKRDLAGLKPQIVLGVSTKDALRDVGALQVKMQAIADKLTNLRIGATTKDAEAAIARLQARLLALTKQLSSITIKADTTKLDADIAREIAKAASLRQQLGKLQMNADNKKALSQIAALELAQARLAKRLKTMKGDLNIAAAQARLADIGAQLKVLNSKDAIIVLKADMTSLRADLTASLARVEALQSEAADIKLGGNVDAAKLFATQSGLLGIEAAMEKLKPAAVAGDVALGVLGKALVGTGTGWGFLTRSVTLFGGAFNRVLPVVLASVAVWHVVADAIIEIGAVWIPATLAVGAFAIAASDAAVTIQRRMQAVHTVMDATGQSIPPMTSALEQLHKAVQPQVYQLFGDALRIMNSRQGTFAAVAKATGTVLDQLGARITYAITSTGKLGTSTDHLSAFWRTAISDVSKLGDSIGNVFGIFGNLFKAIPGFASGLLTIGDDFTKILEAASAAIVPLLKWILLLHGYILYSGLAVTATLAFIGGLANLAKQFVTFAAGPVIAGVNAIKSFASTVAAIGTFIASGAVKLYVFASAFRSVAASEGLFAAVSALAQGAAVRLAAAMAFLSANPLIGLAIAAAALGALIYALSRAKDSAQSFNDTMQQTIAAASLGSVASVIQNAQAATSAKLAQSTTVLNKALAEQGVRTGQASRSWGNETAAVYNATKAHNELTQAQSQLSSQQKLVSSRFADLTGKYGSSTAALGLLNAAGITGAQITSTQGHAWAEALIQIDSTVQAYRAMGTQAGTLGNDLDALGRTATDQYQAVQKLNGAWSSFISDVTSTQGTFDTVAQGFSTLSDHSGNLILTLGKLKATYRDAAGGATLNASLASSTAAVASAQSSLNRLQTSGRGTALQLAAAHTRLTAAQDRLTAAQLNLANAQSQGKAAIDALTPAGIALNQAFGDQVSNLDKLFASWRTAGLAGNLFTAGVKDGIAPMLKYAAGSQEATAQLVALAQEAGYQGPISFSALVKWLGSTHGATQKLKNITNQATEQEALLTGAMQAQGNFIANKLLGDINQAILSYAGVEKAVTNYGTAVAQSGKDSSFAQSKMTGAINAIVTAEASMGDNASQMAAIVAKTFGISMPDAMGRVKTSLGILADKAVPGAKKAFETFAEVGLHKTQNQAHDLWNEIATKLGPHLDALGDLAGGKAKNKFIDWAVNGLHKSKDEATFLWQELVKLQDHIDNLHGKNVRVGVNFVGSGAGSIAFKESIPGVTVGPQSQGILGFHAAGGLIGGGIPGKDSVLGMLMPGEVVVPTNMVRAGAVDHLRGRLPGFAAGGSVSDVMSHASGAGGILPAGQSFMQKAEEQFGRAVEAAFARAVIAKFKNDMNALGGSGPAIVSYARSFLGKIPYVFGGNSLASGIDCSGFTQAVYGKFGIHAPRTSEAQFAWATKSSPVPGALAFYVSPAGGPPPGHVAIVQNKNSVISQGGGMGPTIESLGFLPLMGTGVPKGGLPGGTGGSGNQAIAGGGGGGGTRGAVRALMQQMAAARGWTGAEWNALDYVETKEAGYSLTARNPSSGAYGLAQFINGPSEYYQYGGNPFSAAGQITGFFNYIACVPLDGRILTRDGWKTYSQVEVGDETIGYDHATSASAWTKITAVHHYENAPVTRMFSNRVDLRSTPNHRWLTEKNIQTRETAYRREEFTETQHIGTRHRIRLAAPHKDDSAGLPLTLAEAELLGWIAGDGHVAYRAPTGLVDVSVFQSEAKPKQLAALRVLLEGTPHSEYTRPPVSGRAPIHQFRLRTPYARDLFTRSRYEDDLELMVLRMSGAQRAAFVAGLLEADGYMDPRGTWTFCQNDGPVLRAFMLAAYLMGYWCNALDSAGQKHVSLHTAYVGSGSGFHREDLEPEPVWCVTTELGSWTAGQSGQVFLTGNSRYGDPIAAARHEQAFNWYGQGGLVPGFAAGGSLGAKLAVAQAGERSKYFGLEHSFATGPAKYRTNTTLGELHTLTARQAAELSAYAALFQGGASQSELSHLGSAARAVARTAGDKMLNRSPGGYPKFGADLRRYAGQLSTLSASKVPAGGLGSAPPPAAHGTGAPSGQTAQQGAAWLKAWQTRHGGGFGAAWGPVVVNQQIAAMQAAEAKAAILSRAGGLSAAQHRHYAAVAADETKRLAVLNRELTTERSYRGLLGASDTTLTADIRAAGSTPSLAGNVRSWQAQITRQKGTIAAISKMLGYSDATIAAQIAAAEKAGTLGPGGTPLPKITHVYGGDVSDSIGAFLHSVIAPFARGGMARYASGGMATFDNGGTLFPGENRVWNGTGANEHLVPAGQPVRVEVELSWAGDAPAEVVRMLRKHVKSSGGNVQRALGQQGTVSGGQNWKMGWSS